MEKIFFHVMLASLEKYDLFSRAEGIFSMTFEEAGAENMTASFAADNYKALLETKAILYKTALAFCGKLHFEDYPIKKYSLTVKRAMEYVQNNLKNSLNLKEISKELSFSESKIRKAFLRETGKTISAYIDELVFLEARKLLGQGDLSIKEISDKLGFCDQFYFSRRFKEKHGKTPSRYRKECLLMFR